MSINHSDWEVGRGLGDLADLVELGLGGVGVQDGGDGLAIDHGGGEVSWSSCPTEGVVGTGSCRQSSWELGPGSGYTEQSS